MTFKETDIRPEKLMKKADAYLYQDLKYLQSKKKFFKNIKCPACNNFKKKYYLKKHGLKIFICKKCDTFYTCPRPTNEILTDFYKNSKLYKFWHNFIFPMSEKVRSKKIFLPRVNQIIKICKKYKIPKKNIIDVGAGYGTFCKILKKKKFFKEVIALEPNIDGAKRCMEKKIKTLNISIENLPKKDLCNVSLITCFEVIEHLYDPFKFLKKINKLCGKNTYVVLTCPNGMGFDISFLEEKSETIHYEHLNYFNTDSIKLLAKRAGFKTLEVATPGVLDVDIMRNKFHSKIFRTKNNFFKQIFKNSIVANNLQSFLIKNKLSSNMWAVLKKR